MSRTENRWLAIPPGDWPRAVSLFHANNRTVVEIPAQAGHRAYALRPMTSTPTPAGHEVTAREWDVLAGIARGHTNKQIGEFLHLSEDTIKTHARHLFKKLGVRDRAQAVARGYDIGLLGTR